MSKFMSNTGCLTEDGHELYEEVYTDVDSRLNNLSMEDMLEASHIIIDAVMLRCSEKKLAAQVASIKRR